MTRRMCMIPFLGVSRTNHPVAAVVMAWVMLVVPLTVPSAAPGYETEVTSTPTGIPCLYCHGGDSTVSSGTVDARRKGPHGGYTTGTAKCESCHFTHDAPTDNLLMPAQTVRATCELCHDGTGGNGVYGTIKARTGEEPFAAHRIDVTSLVPAGSASGETTMAFSGENGYLTCIDCHSPHDNNTVQPFLGDRMRTVADEGTSTPTNRLLRRNPGDSPYGVAVYGSGWCGACHRGSLETTEHPGFMGDHTVETETAGFSYDHVVRVTGVESTATEFGPLGGSNFGYVMPFPRSAEQTGHSPICQQCHEDARHVGDEPTTTPFTVRQNEVFTVSQPDGHAAADNPRFQVFPHESDNPGFRLENGDDLCLNCHPK